MALASQKLRVDYDVLASMLRDGYTKSDCARHFGVTPATIGEHVQRLAANPGIDDQVTNDKSVVIMDKPSDGLSEVETAAIRHSRDLMRWLDREDRLAKGDYKTAKLRADLMGSVLDNIRKASPNHQASAKNNRPMANIVQQVHGDVVNVTPSGDNAHKANVLLEEKSSPAPAKHPPGG